MKKAAIIGIVIAIIVAGGLGIYAVSSTQEGPLVDESSLGLSDEAVATVEEDLVGEPDAELGFQDSAAATVEEDLGEKPDAEVGFQDSASATVKQP